MTTPAQPPPANAQEPPAKIWLQWHGDAEPDPTEIVCEDAVTWSQEQIFPHDLCYTLDRPAPLAGTANAQEPDRQHPDEVAYRKFRGEYLSDFVRGQLKAKPKDHNQKAAWNAALEYARTPTPARTANAGELEYPLPAWAYKVADDVMNLNSPTTPARENIARIAVKHAPAPSAAGTEREKVREMVRLICHDIRHGVIGSSQGADAITALLPPAPLPACPATGGDVAKELCSYANFQRECGNLEAFDLLDRAIAQLTALAAERDALKEGLANAKISFGANILENRLAQAQAQLTAAEQDAAGLAEVVELVKEFGPGLIARNYDIGSPSVKALVDMANQALSRHAGRGSREGGK